MCNCRQCAQNAHKLKLDGGSTALGLPQECFLQKQPTKRVLEAFESSWAQLPTMAGTRSAKVLRKPTYLAGWRTGSLRAATPLLKGTLRTIAHYFVPESSGFRAGAEEVCFLYHFCNRPAKALQWRLQKLVFREDCISGNKE